MATKNVLPLNKLPGVMAAAKRQRDLLAALRATRPATPKVETK